MKQEALTLRLRKARAEAKMFAETTTHAKGSQPKKHTKAMKKVEKYAVKIDTIAQSVFNAKKLKLESTKDGEVLSARARALRVLDNFDPVAGFIIFQYSESMARCVEDFEKYSTFPYNLCYPQVH
jgi:hypothetical protein